MRNLAIAVSALFALTASHVEAASGPGTPVATAPSATVALTKIARQLPAGSEYGVRQEGVLCIRKETLRADAAVTPVDIGSYGPIFSNELVKAGLMQPTTTRANLFESPAEPDQGPDYEVGALVHGLNVKLCSWLLGQTVFHRATATVEVQWQIYSRAQKKVVASMETTGASRKFDYGDPINRALSDAFATASAQLVSSAQFRTLLQAPIERGPGSSSAEQVRIRLVGPSPSARALAEAVGSVVLVSLPDSFGSGVLLSEDGYILTNAHVVQNSSRVTIRWSDGIETVGDVVRSHKGRDVALVKTDPRGREPLPVRLVPVQVGDSVTAIGSPMRKELQSTVTRGIVSAKRIFDGYSFIQSDVAVTHGNSGGPLLDGQGAVVGLTVQGVSVEDVPIGLNLFIPIKDALDFLKLDLQQPAPPPSTTAAVAGPSASAASSLDQHQPRTR